MIKILYINRKCKKIREKYFMTLLQKISILPFPTPPFPPPLPPFHIFWISLYLEIKLHPIATATTFFGLHLPAGSFAKSWLRDVKGQNQKLWKSPLYRVWNSLYRCCLWKWTTHLHRNSGWLDPFPTQKSKWNTVILIELRLSSLCLNDLQEWISSLSNSNGPYNIQMHGCPLNLS